ncbi:hypothetical protein SDC9_81770 [bioreactor metagenome]|uniref:Uncharacterized protein n=1 Tax=bioreactor metagenome TaxID=1076179 RepID=A0A644Z2T4_9ZZZZ
MDNAPAFQCHGGVTAYGRQKAVSGHRGKRNHAHPTFPALWRCLIERRDKTALHNDGLPAGNRLTQRRPGIDKAAAGKSSPLNQELNLRHLPCDAIPR